MLKRIVFMSALLSATGAAPLTRAGTPDQGQWVTTITGGTSLPSNDALQSAGQGTPVDAGRFDPSLTGSMAVPSLEHLDFADAFNAGPGFGIEAGYVAANDLEPFLRLARSQLNGRTVRIGTVEFDSHAAPIMADFDDLNSWSLNLGLRYFLVDTGRMRAFVDGYAGADRADALNARVSIDGTSQPAQDVHYLPQRTKFDAGVDGGVSVKVSDTTDLSLSVGAQYVAGHEMDWPAADTVGLDGASVHDEHWSVPLNLGLSMHF